MMAYLLKVDGTIEQMGWNPSLAELQAAVGGYIEMVRTNNVGYMYCNEEGKLLGLPVNRAATSMIDFDDVVVGDVVVMELEEEKVTIDNSDQSKAIIAAEEEKSDEKKIKAVDKENLPMEALLEKVFSSKQIPRQKPKSGRFWKGERGQFRQIKRDRGQRNTFEQRLQKKEEMRRNKELADMLTQKKNQAKEELRKRIEDNKAKKLENERKTEQYQVIKNPAKLKRMKKKQLRMLEKRDILAKN